VGDENDYYDNIILSTSYEKTELIETILQKARQQQQQQQQEKKLSSLNKVSIMASKNDFYDTGLWCDATTATTTNTTISVEDYEYIVLMNDSVYMLREYNGILLELKQQQQRPSLQLVSLCESYSRNQYWLESVMRGFSSGGFRTFQKYSCVPHGHPRHCDYPPSMPTKRKQCLIRHHEIGLARQYNRSTIKGLYAAEINQTLRHWQTEVEYFKELVQTQQFPVAKVKESIHHIQSLEDPLLQNCTKRLDWDWLHALKI
jgi:hypothetical protein